MAKRRDTAPAHLDLVPVMNLVTILIPFLLLSAQFVAISVIESTMPAIAPDDTTPPDPTPKLDLTLRIDAAGFHLSGPGTEVLDERDIGCEGVCGPDGYDYDTLAERCAALLTAWPEATLVRLVPDVHVPYEVLVRTMDATREHAGESLFPSVVIAAGL
jgi:biopolymer transport protein ExbD